MSRYTLAELSASPLERKWPTGDGLEDALIHLEECHEHRAWEILECVRRALDCGLRDTARIEPDECSDDELRRLLGQIVTEVQVAVGHLEAAWNEDDPTELHDAQRDAYAQIDTLAWGA